MLNSACDLGFEIKSWLTMLICCHMTRLAIFALCGQTELSTERNIENKYQKSVILLCIRMKHNLILM